MKNTEYLIGLVVLVVLAIYVLSRNTREDFANVARGTVQPTPRDQTTFVPDLILDPAVARQIAIDCPRNNVYDGKCLETNVMDRDMISTILAVERNRVPRPSLDYASE